MPTTPASARFKSVRDAVKLVAADSTAPTLVTLTGAGNTVAGRAETVPGGELTADTAAAILTGMARLFARHPGMFGADVAGYAVVLPGERVAFAADRIGATHHIQLPGAPTEPLRRDRWGGIRDRLHAMINAAG
ncbi:hypothetical protein [Krasilnikovia sp. MM14-A1259]|uniref:hypothetical protein n=1 Tax=Krasilnikovia sp. MM14-A1259 TaxID=3373539 RepID=UPI003807A4A3